MSQTDFESVVETGSGKGRGEETSHGVHNFKETQFLWSRCKKIQRLFGKRNCQGYHAVNKSTRKTTNWIILNHGGSIESNGGS